MFLVGRKNFSKIPANILSVENFMDTNMHVAVFDVCNFKKKNVRIKIQFTRACCLKAVDHKCQKCQKKDFKNFSKGPQKVTSEEATKSI